MRFAKGQPTPSDVHVDAPLTNISVAYMQDQSRYVAQKIFPIVPVPKQTNKYFKFTKDDWFRDEVKRRAPSTESAGGGWNMTTDSYSCDVWGLHKDLDKQLLANYDNPLNPTRNATQWLTQMMLIRQEVQWAADFFKSGIWGTDNTPGTLWDTITSDIQGNVETAKKTILQNTGFKANTFLVGYDVYLAMKKNTAIKDQFKYTTSRSITKEMLQAYFDIDNFMVLEAVQNTANEGATGSYSFINGSKAALVAYVNPAPAIEMPSAGYFFNWADELSPSEGMGPWGVTQFYIQERKAIRVEIEAAWDNKLVSSDLGYMFNAAVT
jgi:hypothetical protein